MRSSIFLIFFMLISKLMFAQSSFNDSKKLHNLYLEVDKTIKGKGNIFIAIYKGADGFLNTDKAYLLKVIPSGETLFSVDLVLETGDYAIAIYQDINQNGKLDQSKLGFPVEPYGFSNNPKIFFGPPTFHACSFSVNANFKKISISLKQ